jgi:hypothetical protein
VELLACCGFNGAAGLSPFPDTGISVVSQRAVTRRRDGSPSSLGQELIFVR